MNRIRARSAAAAAAGILTLALVVAAQAKPPVNPNGSGNLALRGYDAVAYLTDGRAVKGDRQIEHAWNGAVWRFAKPEHREAFARDPGKFAPQFGGYCAYAVSRGYTADIDPEAFSVVSGRLYLNYSKSVRRTWERDVPGNIARAEANWPGVLNK